MTFLEDEVEGRENEGGVSVVGASVFQEEKERQVIRSGDLTVVSSHYPAQKGTIRSLLLIPPPAPLSFFHSESLIHHSKSGRQAVLPAKKSAMWQCPMPCWSPLHRVSALTT